MFPKRAWLGIALVGTLFLVSLAACGGKAEVYDPAAYINLAAGNTWTYHLQVAEGRSVIFDPVFINPPGILGSTVTNGSARVRFPEREFTITVTEVISETESRIEISDGSAIPWIPLDAAQASLVIVEQDGGALSLALRISPLGAEDWLLSQVWAVIPGEAGELSAQEVETPAGVFQTLHLVINHAAVQEYTPAYLQETWMAAGVGMVRTAAYDDQNQLIYILELIDHRVR